MDNLSQNYLMLKISPTEAWIKSQPLIKTKVGEMSYQTWFSTLGIKEFENKLIIQAPDEFFKNWVIEHYATIIEQALSESATTPISYTVVVDSSLLEPAMKNQLAKIENLYIQPESINIKPKILNNKFTFDSFVIGPSNRFAASASLAVAESPAKSYNPLFIYGEVGLGKTHLLQAITHKIRELNPSTTICYISSENFTNELIESIRNRSTLNFRKKYREIDVLLIDDIQFIAGKESTQEEFFNTFNCLHSNHKQIIITSDRPPKEIAKLEERLISRFNWGLITDIQPPDFETRVAILRKKIIMEKIRVPDDVIYYIAEQIKTNIRELEGALIRVTAYSTLQETPLNLNIATLILQDMVKQTIKTISIEMIQKSVADFFKIQINDLKNQKRHKTIVLPRQIAMYLSRTLTQMSLPEIGLAFGGKDHTTVLHSYKKIYELLKSDETIKKVIMELATNLKQ